MSIESFLSLIVFTLVAALTPGPNNLMLLASGVNFGFMRTIPHMAGITLGFLFLMLAVGGGIGALMALYPTLSLALKVAGGAYLLYLAWMIASTRSLDDRGGRAGEPLRFMQAVAFQWVNPKAWIMALTAFALYSDPHRPVTSGVLVIGCFIAVTIPSLSIWTAFGTALRGILRDPVHLRRFNIIMGLLLVASLVPMVR